MNPYRRWCDPWWRYWFVDFLPECWWNIKNLVRWTPTIWGTNHFDWSSLARVMEFQMGLMIANTEHWHVMCADRTKREMQICAHILKRLREDDYAFQCVPFDSDYRRVPRRRNGNFAWPVFKHTDAIQKNELELFLKTFSNFQRWWD